MTQHVHEAPAGCTLGSAMLATQRDRWKSLYARAGTERIETHDGVRVGFRREPDVERELRELVAVETVCCAWADWAITTGERTLALEIRSDGEGVSVIRSWFVAP